MKMILSSLMLMVATTAWATTQDDVNFAQRQCQQRNDPDKCATYREVAKSYQREQRNVLEYNAAVQARRPMSSAYYNDHETNFYSGNNKGVYRWNASRNRYCYHNRNGSVQRCVN